jgi:microcystin-dependent protein
MTFWKWSKSAASNAGADPTINYAEGQAPSSLNDSARAAMAACAKYRDDMAGALATAGTGAAYTLATNQVITSLVDKFPIAFTPHVTNSGPCTLNVDGTGAVPLRSSTGAELGAGVLVASTVYTATYFAATNEWLLHSFFVNPYNVPLGGMMPYLGASAPNANFALPYGQAVSRVTYAGLFALTGTSFGSGDGTTTFNLPDLRGRAVFGQDNMGGAAASRITVAGGNFDGTVIGGTGGGQNQTLTQAQLPNVNLVSSSNSLQGNDILSGQLGNGVPTNPVGTYGQTGGGYSGANQAMLHAIVPSFTVTTPLGGFGASHPILSPAIILPFILRII